MPTTIWMAGWQMECCGTPFEVGATVSWHLRPPTDVAWLGTVLPTVTGPSGTVPATIDAVEDHHGDTSSPPTTAKVVSIATVHCRFDPSPVDGSAVVTSVRSAQKWNDDLGDRHFAGFLVRLRTEA